MLLPGSGDGPAMRKAWPNRAAAGRLWRSIPFSVSKLMRFFRHFGRNVIGKPRSRNKHLDAFSAHFVEDLLIDPVIRYQAVRRLEIADDG